MARERSLRKRGDFAATLKEGRRYRYDGVTLAAMSGTRGPARLGLAVRAGGAVQRNRIKRRLRAAFAEAGLRHSDVVARADESAAQADYQELVALFARVERTDA